MISGLKALVLILFFLFTALSSSAQNTTINTTKKPEREAQNAHKVMLIPFEPKLYMSEVDRAINAETDLTAKQIKHKLRDGLNEQLGKAFKNLKYGVVDLMDDTVKYSKDLLGIYQYLSYSYQKVPNQENYKAPEKEKKETTIEKGQLNVETNSDARFMNAKITNPKVVPYLYSKYKTDLFVFVNQLDIIAAGSATRFSDGSTNRKIILHYTVYTFDAKEINSGIAEVEFEPELNNPNKIVTRYFSIIANTIAQRVSKGLMSPEKTKK